MNMLPQNMEPVGIVDQISDVTHWLTFQHLTRNKFIYFEEFLDFVLLFGFRMECNKLFQTHEIIRLA